MNTRYTDADMAQQIADSLLKGESVAMGYWEADYCDFMYDVAERGQPLIESLRLFQAGKLSADDLRIEMDAALAAYAEKHSFDRCEYLKQQMANEAIRERDEERMIARGDY